MSFTPQPIRGMSIDKTHPLARGLAGYWPTLEWTGDSLHDYSVDNYHGTLLNSPARTSLNRNPAISYNGTNQACTLPAGVLAGATEYSFSFWARNNTPGSGLADMVLEHANPYFGSEGSFALYFHSQEQRLYVSRRTSGGYNGGRVPFLKGEMHHVVATSSSDRWRIWIDGKEPTYDETHNANATESVPDEITYIASRGASSNYAEAELAGLAVYRRLLTTTEIQTLYADPWAMFRRRLVIPSEQPPTYDIQGSNAYGSSPISFGWTVNPA